MKCEDCGQEIANRDILEEHQQAYCSARDLGGKAQDEPTNGNDGSLSRRMDGRLFIPDANPDYYVSNIIQEEIARILVMCDDRHERVNLLLTGPAGTGKTELALHIAALRQSPTFLGNAYLWRSSDEVFGREYIGTSEDAEGRAHSVMLYDPSTFVSAIEKEGATVIINDLPLMQNRSIQNGLNDLLDPRIRQAWVDQMTRSLGRPVRVARGVLIIATMNEGAEYCVGPETKILTANLQYVQAKNLKVGDSILGFEEYPGPSRKQRRLMDAKVTAMDLKPMEAYRIKLATGETIDATPEHKWLIRPSGNAKLTWVRTDELARQVKAGRKRSLSRFMPLVEKRETRNAGYIAGAYDADGWLYRQGTGRTVISFAQNENATLTEVISILKEYGWPYRVEDSRKCKEVATANGRAQAIRFLMEFQPPRLLEVWKNLDHQRMDLRSLEVVEIESIEYLGVQEMATLSSSSQTYFAEGFGAHNTGNIKMAKQIKDRFTNKIFMPHPPEEVQVMILMRRTGIDYENAKHLCSYAAKMRMDEADPLEISMRGLMEASNKIRLGASFHDALWFTAVADLPVDQQEGAMAAIDLVCTPEQKERASTRQETWTATGDEAEDVIVTPSYAAQTVAGKDEDLI